jgi:hypothetical protein
VRGDQALCMTEIVSRESGDGTSDGGGLGDHGDRKFYLSVANESVR